jgi:outer membrane receptor for ferrienterochelin and colicin
MRYDKSEFFDGHITPRIGALVSLSKNQNIRFSYQTGYQNPSAQDQYIGLDAGAAVLMGSSSDNVDRFKMRFMGGSGNNYTITGKQVQENSLTIASVQAFGAAAAAGNFDPSLLVSAGNLGNVEAQYVKSYDFGYRINGKKTALDINAYFTQWDNFISAVNVITPKSIPGGLAQAFDIATGDYKVFSYDANTDEVVNTLGVSAGLETQFLKVFDLNMTYSYNKMDFNNSNPAFEAGFNTPQTRIVMSLGSTKIAENFSFNVSAKYHDSYLWQQSGFIDGVIPNNTTVDAAMNFKIPKINAKIKVGAVNLGGCEYLVMPGSGMVGSQYYVGFTLNP